MKDLNNLVKLLKKLELLNQQEFLKIEPMVQDAMASGIQDSNYLERIIEPLENILLLS